MHLLQLFRRGIQHTCLLVLLLFSISSCQSTETNREQLNNNGSGMDQDHTAAPPDTIPSSQLPDTLQDSGQKPDTVK